MTEGQAERLAERSCDHDQKQTIGVRPPKELHCIVPGCQKRFRPSTMYKDFVGHFERMHGKEFAQ